MSERVCHNCSLPSGAITTPGRLVRLTLKPENGFPRERRVTVWCHSDECALQAMAIARYGPASHRWPITMAQFRAMNRLDRYETHAETRINSGAAETDFGIMGGDALPGFCNAQNGPKRVSGRPRRWRSNAERQRAWRERSAHSI